QICSAVGMLREVEAGWPSAVSVDLNAEHVTLSDDEIRERMSGNLCRCAAYANIVPAIAEVLLIPSPDAKPGSGSGVYPERSELSCFRMEVCVLVPLYATAIWLPIARFAHATRCSRRRCSRAPRANCATWQRPVGICYSVHVASISRISRSPATSVSRAVDVP